jgi:hypothetical protein
MTTNLKAGPKITSAININEYPLDYLTGATGAYSLRKLKYSYEGFCLKLRRTNDNAQLDIGFSGNYVDIDAMLQFVPSGSEGLVDTWYDQSENSNNLTAATTFSPYIVESDNSISNYKGVNGLRFIGTTTGKYLIKLGYNLNIGNAYFILLSRTDEYVSQSKIHFAFRSNVTAMRRFYKTTVLSGSERQSNFLNGSTASTATYPYDNFEWQLSYGGKFNSLMKWNINEYDFSSNTNTESSTAANLFVGVLGNQDGTITNAATSGWLNGNISECIFFNENQVQNEGYIKKNIYDYYLKGI